jgi:hypothetical protein
VLFLRRAVSARLAGGRGASASGLAGRGRWGRGPAARRPSRGRLRTGPHPYQDSAPGLIAAGSHLRPAPRCTAGDRCEPLASDGMWTKRGPGCLCSIFVASGTTAHRRGPQGRHERAHSNVGSTVDQVHVKKSLLANSSCSVPLLSLLLVRLPGTRRSTATPTWYDFLGTACA